MSYVAKPPAERFWPKVDASGDCWDWTAAKNNGYGSFMLRKVPTPVLVAAHRWSYEELVGPIPDGLDLDHLCRNRACVNPDHLEPVTRQENLRRGSGTLRGRCRKGHPLDAHNLVVIAGTQRCRTCRKATRDAWVRRTGRVAA